MVKFAPPRELPSRALQSEIDPYLSKAGRMVRCSILLPDREQSLIAPDLPPSSRGPGRSPLKAKTGVRIPLGVPPLKNFSKLEKFLFSLGFDNACVGIQFSNRWRQTKQIVAEVHTQQRPYSGVIIIVEEDVIFHQFTLTYSVLLE